MGYWEIVVFLYSSFGILVNKKCVILSVYYRIYVLIIIGIFLIVFLIVDLKVIVGDDSRYF